MKTLLRIIIICLILFASCEKISDQPYTLKFYGDAYEDIGYSVTIVSDGYVIAGQLEDIGRSDGFITSRDKNMGIIKTGWDGNIIWTVSVGGKNSDLGSKVYQLTDGSLICAGTFTDTTTGSPRQKEILVVKLSPSGSVVWKNTYGGPGNQTAQDIVKTSDGFIILGSTDIERQPVTDSTGNEAGKTDILLLKITETGDSVNSVPHGFGKNDIGATIKPDNSGNYIVLGTTERSLTGQAKNNLFLLSVNNLGDAIEQNFIGGMDDEVAADMEVLSDGYLLACTVGKDMVNQKIQVIKLKNDIFAPPYFSNSITIADPANPDIVSCGVNSISTYNTDSFVLAGYSGTVTASEMMVFEMDGNGNAVAGHQIIKGSTGIQVAYDVVAGDDGYIIAVGKNSYDINSMISLLKFRF
jgi:hypothetical protein